MSGLRLTDQIGQSIALNEHPKQIVSLVPSITYLLYKLGLDEEVSGITRFCKLPAHWKKQKSIVGGTKQVKYDRIAQLNPGIILANKEENTKEMVDKLLQIAPVYVSDVKNLDDNAQFITDLGKIFQKEDMAKKLIQDIRQAEMRLNPTKRLKAAYFIWKKPWMTIGGDTFISKMMQLAGFDNVFAGKKRYPVVDMKQLEDANPALILLSSEPYPFKEIEQKELQMQFPNACVLLVEGEPFTWFGAYPLEAFAYFQSLQNQLNLCIPKKKS